MTKALLDFISKPESNGDYNIVWGGIKSKDQPPKTLTGMTIREVLAWQDRIDPFYMSEAAGRYQIMEDTLRGLYSKAGLTLDDLYSRENQDRLAIQLIKDRGLKKYQQGQISIEAFANNLAHEWASLPLVTGPNKGRSAYAGDGLNKAHVTVADFLAAIKTVKAAPLVQPIVDHIPTPQPTAPAPSFWAGIVAALAAFFGKAA